MNVKILISIPDQLASRMRHAIPARSRSAVFVRLIEKEVEKREKLLYEAALAVENDDALHREMDEWNETREDGLKKDESW